MTAKGQFYIIASVFVLISLTVLFVFTLFVDFGTFTLPTQSTDFDNLQTAIMQRNNWLSGYWFDLDWKTKTTVEISLGYANPVEIDADITTGCDSARVFQRTGNSLTEIASDVTAIGCNVTFNAPSEGIYDIFWNGTNMGKSNSDGNEITPASKTIAQVPQEGICSHFAQILPKKNIAFTCSAAEVGDAYNYSISFRSPDFTYYGSII